MFPLTLKTWPPSSPHSLAFGSTLYERTPLAPLIVPVPANGTQGCWLESPVPAPWIDPAPISLIEPVPLAAMFTVLPSTLVEAVPAYEPVIGKLLTGAATAAAATSAAANAISTTVPNVFTVFSLLVMEEPFRRILVTRASAAIGAGAAPAYGELLGAQRNRAPSAGVERCMLHPLLSARFSPASFDVSHELTAGDIDLLLEA